MSESNASDEGHESESHTTDEGLDEDLGQATIVYEGPDEDPVEKQVENEQVAYFQDHWMVKTGETDEGKDRVMRIPSQRVYHVERDVEAFEAEVASLRDQVQSIANELREKVSSVGTSDGGRQDQSPAGGRR